MAYNVLIVGVGGQGTLLAAKIASRAAVLAGCDVKTSEVHGMAQRGGSVASHVKFDKTKVHSPVIDFKNADAVLALEMLEALRAVVYLNAGGRMFVSAQKIYPSSVTAGAACYPPNIAENLINALTAERVYLINAAFEAQKVLDGAKEQNAALTGEKCANVYMLGKMAAVLSAGGVKISEELWREAVKTSVKPRFAEINERVFTAGYTNNN